MLALMLIKYKLNYKNSSWIESENETICIYFHSLQTDVRARSALIFANKQTSPSNLCETKLILEIVHQNELLLYLQLQFTANIYGYLFLVNIWITLYMLPISIYIIREKKWHSAFIFRECAEQISFINATEMVSNNTERERVIEFKSFNDAHTFYYEQGGTYIGWSFAGHFGRSSIMKCFFDEMSLVCSACAPAFAGLRYFRQFTNRHE